jgi:regulatory protein
MKKASLRFTARRRAQTDDSGPLPIGTVTSVEIQKRTDSGRVNVRIDGEFAFSLQADSGLRLSPGERLDESRVRELLDRDAIERAYQRAIRFLAARPRSESEVRRRLRTAGMDEPATTHAIARLQRERLLDDEEFASYWVGQRQAFRPRGPRALRAELRSKGVTTEAMADAIAEAASEQAGAAYRAALVCARRHRACARPDFDRVVGCYLARRGFDLGAARAAVQELWLLVEGDGAAL